MADKEHCQACRDLFAECGPVRFPHYARKLLIRGWAGSVSPVEKAYQQAHRTEAQQRQAASAAARLPGAAPKPAPQDVFPAGAV